MHINADQCRAARALLNWSRKVLSVQSETAERTIIDFERGARSPHISTIKSIVLAFETAGVKFIDENGGGVGVRFEKPTNSR